MSLAEKTRPHGGVHYKGSHYKSQKGPGQGRVRRAQGILALVVSFSQAELFCLEESRRLGDWGVLNASLL